MKSHETHTVCSTAPKPRDRTLLGHKALSGQCGSSSEHDGTPLLTFRINHFDLPIHCCQDEALIVLIHWTTCPERLYPVLIFAAAH